MIKKWKKLSSRVLLSHPRLVVHEDKVLLPDGRHSTYVYTPSDTDTVIIIATNENMELLIQREYNYPPNVVLYELPGGSMEPGESIRKAAKRELAEEAGYMPKTIKNLGYFYATNRKSNRRQHVLWCSDLVMKKLAHDEDEFIESEWMNETKVREMIARGKFHNINLLAALNVWFHAKPKL